MRQHTRPVYVKGERSQGLIQLNHRDKDYDEAWLQNIIHQHPESLPISEVEPLFSDPIALCTELELASGFCDNVLINSNGYITMAECKLWRNPEARRTVIAQILDYAKDLSQWSYNDFEMAVLKARKQKERSLIDLVKVYYPEVNEIAFIDTINYTLRNARILLLIVGDGVRDNAVELVEFLNSFGHMHFVLAIVEMPVYSLSHDGGYFITPRIMARTTELQRNLITPGPAAMEKQKPRYQTASESEFYERLALNTGEDKARELRDFVDVLKEKFRIEPRMGRGKTLSMNLKTADDRFNLASVQESGLVYFYGIVSKTEEAGDSDIGIDYLKTIAEMVVGEFYDGYEKWSWCVKKNGEYPEITDFLEQREKWIKAIDDTLSKIRDLEDG